jgi:hypothetical protein
MSDFEAALRLLLSCSMCGTYYGYSDLVVACEQADAAALEEALAALYAERPTLDDGDRGGAGHAAKEIYPELTVLIAEVERRRPGGDQQ